MNSVANRDLNLGPATISALCFSWRQRRLGSFGANDLEEPLYFPKTVNSRMISILADLCVIPAIRLVRKVICLPNSSPSRSVDINEVRMQFEDDKYTCVVEFSQSSSLVKFVPSPRESPTKIVHSALPTFEIIIAHICPSRHCTRDSKSEFAHQSIEDTLIMHLHHACWQHVSI